MGPRPPFRRLGLVALFAIGLSACSPEIAPGSDLPAIEILHERGGDGRIARSGDIVRVNVHVRTEEGKTLIDDPSFRFRVGAGTVIEAVDTTVPGMAEGGRRTVSVPPHQHWGRAGYAYGAIPANATLIMDVELLSIEVGGETTRPQ